MNRSVSVGVVVLLVVCIGVAPVAAVSPATDGTGPSGAQQAALDDHEDGQPRTADTVIGGQDFDQTTFEITVHENGSATWTFRHEQRFDASNESEEIEAFESFAERFESEETDLYEGFTTQAQRMTETDAGREMEATNFQRSTAIETLGIRTRGVVEMSFIWHGFAAVEGDTVYVGDVFEDLYLYPDQRIVIEAGDDLVFDRVEPEDSVQYSGASLENAESVQWSGEQQFLDGQPRVVLVRNDATQSGASWSWQLPLGALVVLAVGGGAFWYRRQRTDDTATGTDPDDGGATASPPDHATAATPAAAPTPGADAVDEQDDGSESESVPDDELLTDEDRVVRLIRENGGRMKQVNIVEETGWSKSKVSMLLSDMEEEGTISKLRVGRENIISLEGFEPEATKSPFEE